MHCRFYRLTAGPSYGYTFRTCSSKQRVNGYLQGKWCLCMHASWLKYFDHDTPRKDHRLEYHSFGTWFLHWLISLCFQVGSCTIHKSLWAQLPWRNAHPFHILLPLSLDLQTASSVANVYLRTLKALKLLGDPINGLNKTNNPRQKHFLTWACFWPTTSLWFNSLCLSSLGRNQDFAKSSSSAWPCSTDDFQVLSARTSWSTWNHAFPLESYAEHMVPSLGESSSRGFYRPKCFGSVFKQASNKGFSDSLMYEHYLIRSKEMLFFGTHLLLIGIRHIFQTWLSFEAFKQWFWGRENIFWLQITMLATLLAVTCSCKRVHHQLADLWC